MEKKKKDSSGGGGWGDEGDRCVYKKILEETGLDEGQTSAISSRHAEEEEEQQKNTVKGQEKKGIPGEENQGIPERKKSREKRRAVKGRERLRQLGK